MVRPVVWNAPSGPRSVKARPASRGTMDTNGLPYAIGFCSNGKGSGKVAPVTEQEPNDGSPASAECLPKLALTTMESVGVFITAIDPWAEVVPEYDRSRSDAGGLCGSEQAVPAAEIDKLP